MANLNSRSESNNERACNDYKTTFKTMTQAQIVEKRVKNQQASCSGFSQLGGLVFSLLPASQ
jgi:hypothetical protein